MFCVSVKLCFVCCCVLVKVFCECILCVSQIVFCVNESVFCMLVRLCFVC